MVEFLPHVLEQDFQPFLAGDLLPELPRLLAQHTRLLRLPAHLHRQARQPLLILSLDVRKFCSITKLFDGKPMKERFAS